jgi:hypothetical protein
VSPDPFSSQAAMDAWIARKFAELRGEPEPAPASHRLGPRKCPQRCPRKRQGQGPRARRPMRSGQRPRKSEPGGA